MKQIYIVLIASIFIGPISSASELICSSSFEKSQSTDSTALWNSQGAPLRFTLEMQLDALKALQSVAYGVPSEKKESSRGVVVDNKGQHSKVSLKVRGRSSLRDLDFPKLSIKFDDLPAQGDFSGVSGFAINGHGFDDLDGSYSPMGRLRSAVTAFREATAYELIESTGIPVRKVRRAIITYIDTKSGKTFEQPAVLLEKHTDMAIRLGAQVLEPTERNVGIIEAHMKNSDLAKLYMIESLLGNRDVSFPAFNLPYSIDNVEFIAFPKTDKPARKAFVPEDFDLASIVTGKVFKDVSGQGSLNQDIGDLLHLRRGFFPASSDHRNASWQRAKVEMIELRPTFEKVIREAQIDEVGRANFTAHIEAFYQMLDYVP